MTKQEVAVLLALFQGNWAHINLTDQQVHVWVDHLRDVPPASGLTVANQLIESNEHFPTVHEFRTLWRAHIRRERERELPPALMAPVPPPELGLAGVQLARVALHDAGEVKITLPPEVELRRKRRPPLGNDSFRWCNKAEHAECGPQLWDPMRWTEESNKEGRHDHAQEA